MASSGEQGNKTAGSIKAGKFLEQCVSSDSAPFGCGEYSLLNIASVPYDVILSNRWSRVQGFISRVPVSYPWPFLGIYP